MIQSFLEILLLLAYLAIALISISIAIYAIAVSYLGRETSRTLWRLRKRREELRKRLKMLVSREKLEEKAIEDELHKSRQEEHEIRDRLFCLSAKGAVWYPCISFSFTLLIAVCGILVIDALSSGYFIVSATAFIVFGFYRLAKALTAIEWASQRIPLPKFEVSFANKATTAKFKIEEKAEIEVCVHNIGDEMAEQLELYVFFPPDFSVQKNSSYEIVEQGPETDYPKYMAAIFREETMHIDTIYIFTVLLKMPKKVGSYTIPVEICERKIGESKHRLIIEIVS